MPDVTSTIVSILRAYVRLPSFPIEGVTTLAELEIDRLDLQMISLDIEDVFNVQIQCEEEIEELATVHSLVANVEALLEAKAKQPAPRPRAKSNWLSTGNERRR
jgi:acyl carrier protein